MKRQNLLGRESKVSISWIRVAGGCALGTTTLCALALVLLLFLSTAINAYLVWRLSGYQISISRPDTAPTSPAVSLVTPGGQPVVPPTPIPTPVPTSPPLPTTPVPAPTDSPPPVSEPAPNTPTPISIAPVPTQASLKPEPVVLAVVDTEVEEREMAELGRRHPSTGSPLAVTLDAEPAVNAPTSEAMTYVVQSGDSLWRIAEGEYGSGTQWELIFEANRDVVADPRRIFPEQELRIPSTP